MAPLAHLIKQEKYECLDPSKAIYQGYYKFLDYTLFDTLVNQICPGFNYSANSDAVSQVSLGIESLVNDNSGSPEHQLALLTSIRMIFT